MDSRVQISLLCPTLLRKKIESTNSYKHQETGNKSCLDVINMDPASKYPLHASAYAQADGVYPPCYSAYPYA